MVEALKGSIGEDLELSEAACLQCLILSPLSLALGLVRHLEVLSREQLVWVLSVGVGVVLLVLGDVEALQLHVLLGTGRWAFHSRLPPGLWIWLCPCIESLSF